jgi:hypothetical protein
MANPKIEVEVVAKVDGLNSGVAAATNGLDKLGKAAKKTSSQVNQLKSSVGAANGSAIAFNRIIQDAPFGLLGVGNNIQQFTEQIAFLKQTTGSTGLALKSFFSSLITPTNLLILGVSALTAGLTAYQMGAFGAKKETEETVTEIERFNQVLSNLANNLSAVDSARLEGNKNTAKQLVELELLNSVLTDSTKSEFERLRAYNLLLEKYPRIIGNISQEKALTDGLGQSYLTIVNAITQRAAAIAVEDKLVELLKQKFTLEEKVVKETLLQNQLLKERERIFEILNSAGLKVNKNGRDFNEILGDQAVVEFYADLVRELINVNKEFQLLGNVVAVQTENALLTNSESVQKLTSQYAEFNQGLISLLDPLDKVKKRILEVIPNITLDKPLLPDVKLPELDIKGNQGFINQIQERIKAINLLRDASRDINDITNYNTQLVALQTQLNSLDFNQLNIARDIIEGLSEAFTGLGSLIGKAFDNPQLGTFVGQFLAFAAKIIAANFTIASSNAVAGASAAAVATGPAAPITLPAFIAGALGVVAAAFAAFGGKGKRASVSSGVGGGSAAQGTSFTGGATGGMFNIDRNISGEFIVRGTDLVYVLGQANNKINKG